MDITFDCDKCGETLTIDEAGAGQLVDCPKCGAPLEVPYKSEPAPPPVPSVPPIPISPFSGWTPICVSQAVRQIGLTMRSGTQLVVSEITLYPKDLVLKAQGVAAEAGKKLGGFSSGLGFWGSPGWVIGGSLVLGAAESLVSGSMASEGADLLRQLGQLQEEIRKSAKSIPVSQIANVELITPPSWIASYKREVEFEVDVPSGLFSTKKEKRQKVEEKHCIHTSEPYVVVTTDEGRELTVVWENVEQYFIV